MIKVILKNSEGSYDITDLCPQINWSGDYLQCGRSLDFQLLSSATDKRVPKVRCEMGNAVTFMQDSRVLFEGNVFKNNKSTNSSLIDVTCFDRGIYLKRNRTSYKFTNQTAEAIARRVCADWGIPVGDIVSTGVSITRNFLGYTLYEIIQTAYTLASAQSGKKYQIVFKGGSLYVLEKTITDETLVIEGGSNLIDASISDSINTMINQVAIYDKNDRLVNTIKNDEAIKLYGLMQEYIKESDDSTAKAKKLLADNNIQQNITANNLGNIANITGGTVVVREPHTGIYGLFYIDGDVHTWKNGLYLNKLVLNFKNIMDEKEVGALPNQTGAKTAGVESTETWSYIYKPGGEKVGG